MALFAISYDLIKRKDYKTLWAEMERLEAHKALNSFYLVSLNNTTAEVRDHLEQYIDEDDRLIVVPFDKRPAHHMALVGTNKWLDANL